MDDLCASLDAVFEAEKALLERVCQVQVPRFFARKEDESEEDYLRANGWLATTPDDDAEFDGSDDDYALLDYAKVLLIEIAELDGVYLPLNDAIRDTKVGEALRKVNATAATVGCWTAHSYAEALLDFAGLYMARRRMACWRFNPQMTPGGSLLSAPPTAAQLKNRLPNLLSDLSDLPCIAQHEVLVHLEKEITQAKAFISAPTVDPWAIDMLSLLEARGGHLTESEADIVAIVKESGRMMSAAEIESALATKFGDNKAGSASNTLAFLTRITILRKGPGGRGYQLAAGGQQ